MVPSNDEISVPPSTNRRDGTVYQFLLYSKQPRGGGGGGGHKYLILWKRAFQLNDLFKKALSASTRSSASVASLSKMSLVVCTAASHPPA